jgi:hypothetical protein
VPTDLSSGALAGQTFYVLSPNLRLPYTLQWSVALEQALGRQQSVTLSYVASAARRLLTSQILNLPNPVTGIWPNPNVGEIWYNDNGPTSDYDSFQAQYQRRMSHGLQALISYTWSHAIDEVSNQFDPGTLERGNADFDVRHNLSAAISYDLPKLNGEHGVSRALAIITNRWSIDSILSARSGAPLNLQAGYRILPDGSFIYVRPDVVPNVPFWVKDSSVPGGQKLNLAAFQPPPTDSNGNFLRQGTLGRNAIAAPGMYQVNLAIRRQVKITERLNLQFRGEMFNILNHPLFGNYANDITNPGIFGQAQSTLANALSSSSIGGGLNSLYQVGGPRSIQLSLKLAF